MNIIPAHAVLLHSVSEGQLQHYLHIAKCACVCVQISSVAGPLCSPPSLPNYDLADPKLSYTAGTVVTLRCAKGYQLAGSDIVKCQENGTWFPRLPSCKHLGDTPGPVSDTPSPVRDTPVPTEGQPGDTSLACLCVCCEALI